MDEELDEEITHIELTELGIMLGSIGEELSQHISEIEELILKCCKREGPCEEGYSLMDFDDYIEATRNVSLIVTEELFSCMIGLLFHSTHKNKDINSKVLNYNESKLRILNIFHKNSVSSKRLRKTIEEMFKEIEIEENEGLNE